MSPQELLICAVSAAVTGNSDRVPDCGDADWQALFQLSAQQKLTAPVYGALRAAMPERVQRAWRSAALQDAALQSRRTEAFFALYRRLSERGCRPIVVKGILCRETYPEPDARISSDEDLYIPAPQYPAFHRIMRQLGMACEEPDYKNAHETRYFGDDLMVEGHWELFPRDHSLLNALNALNDGFFRRCVTEEHHGVYLRVLEATDHLSFLLLHAFKHFINSGVGIRQLCDVARWAKTHEIDWERVKQTLEPARAVCFAGAVFDFCERWLELPFPPGFPRADCGALLSDALSGGIYGSSDLSRRHSGSITLAAAENARKPSRFAAVLRAVFPNRAVMEMSFPWVKRSALLLPAAWSVRIARYLRSRGEGNEAAQSLLIGSERMELLRRYEVIE